MDDRKETWTRMSPFSPALLKRFFIETNFCELCSYYCHLMVKRMLFVDVYEVIASTTTQTSNSAQQTFSIRTPERSNNRRNNEIS